MIASTSGTLALVRMAALSAAVAMLGGAASNAHAQVRGADTAIVMPDEATVPMLPPVLSVSLTGASNYIFRGVSQTENGPAIFAGAKISYDHFYVAAGGENVDFRNGIDVEYDLSAGWASSLAGFDMDVGAIRYGYIGAPTGVSIDTIELRGSVSRTFGAIKVGGSVNYAFEYFGSKRPGTYFEGNASYSFTPKLTVSGAVGRQQIDAGNSYTAWNAGAGYAFNKHIAVGIRYTDTDVHDFGRLYRRHLVASAKLGF
ncbi:hypothetical protein GCM10008023_37150 [Sphingomonas glacialis]|uniref:Porin family protein n=1 Tax=Sphingomonas glacialis TaxID=658225 RepID=A0ABQ3LU28_9SPHN|nr:TorF family putative porin [Sphingomonas glacialis]GHH24735.1 hypothetical protein GCM10008023_37150 [Sphingomonas glacialis]